MSKIVYVTIDGTRYKAKVTQSEGKLHCIVLGPGPLTGKTITLDENAYAKSPTPESGPAVVDGIYTLVAPITGRVMQINVREGAQITKDSCAMVVQAMKMENELNVEVSGMVQEVLVNVGDMVETGQKLLTVSCQSSSQSSP